MNSSISDWMLILNWIKQPNFGPCHIADDHVSFSKDYLLTPELCRFKNNLLTCLFGEFEQQNIKFLGRPGCGKTSFIYHLLNESTHGANGLLPKYSFYIFHANRITGQDLGESDIENIVLEYILDAWGFFYKDCGKGDVYERIIARKIPIKNKLNTITDIYKDKRKEFNKIFVFIIDDADLLRKNEVHFLAKAVLRNLAISWVKKWIMIRKCTYNAYDLATRNLINAFFPDQRIFPEISFFDIIKHRIKNSSPGVIAKNPFSQNICHMVLERLNNGNMRESLSLLKNILETCKVDGFTKSTSEEFIQKYIEKNSINSLIKLESLPNLYESIFRSSFFPLTIDILCMAKFINSPSLLFGAVGKISEERVSKSKMSQDGKYTKIRQEDFMFSVEKLHELGMLNKERIYTLTLSGSLLSDYITRSHYKKLCKDLLSAHDSDPIFWKLLEIDIDYESIAIDMFSWQEISQPEL